MRTGIGSRAVVSVALAAGCGGTVVEGLSAGGTGDASSGSSASSSTGTTSSASTSTSGGGGGAGGGPALACPAAPLGVMGPDDVTGTMLVHRFFENGTTTMVPTDLSATPILALVLAGGGWTSFPGKGAADGTFVVPGVPQGPYVLHFHVSSPYPDERYVYTSERVLALGCDAAGRADAVQAAPQSVQLDAALSNLEPWVGSDLFGMTGDAFQWASFDSAGTTLGPLPSAGATDVHDDTTVWVGGLVDGSKGDLLHVAQMSLRTTAAGSYSVLSRLGTFTGVQMATGVTPVTSMLTTPPLDESLTVDLRASQFAALAPAINPDAVVSEVGCGVSTFPTAGTTDDIQDETGGSLLQVRAGVTDVNLGTLPYPHAFPAGWGEAVGAGMSASVSISVPGMSQTLQTTGIMNQSMPLANLGGGPIVPLLGPVQDPQVNGQSAFAPLTGITTTPTLSWSPPALGTAAGYAVTMYEVGATVTATLVTTETSMTLPPCVLDAGGAYYFVITAIMTSGSVVQYPWLSAPVWATTQTVTSGMTP